MKDSQDLLQHPLTWFCEMSQKVKLLLICLDFSPQNGKPRGLTSVRHPESDVWHSYMRMSINFRSPYWAMVDAFSNPVTECIGEYICIDVFR